MRSRTLFMRTAALVVVLGLLWPAVMHQEANAWGWYAHRRINRMAVFTLPPAMFGFYKRHIDYVSDHAPDPDSRRYAVAGEAERHFIDADYYAKDGGDPFKELPRDWKTAVAKYSEDTLKEYGIVPWYIPVVYGRLVNAFKRGSVDLILYYSAEIGHYIADAHVPLHTSMNYNGQMTDQVGIHAFWETRIPETSGDDYDHFVGRAQYIPDVSDAAWKAVEDSHACLDTVFNMERYVQQRFPESEKYTYVQYGRNTQQRQSKEFIKAYEESMAGMVERRMNAAIISVGSFWYSAWVDAGQPDLDHFEQKDVSDSLKKVLKAEREAEQQSRKMIGRPEPNE